MKKEEIYFDTVELFNEYYGFETLHPLVSVVPTIDRVPFEPPHIITASTPCFSKKTRDVKFHTDVLSMILMK